MAMSGTVGLSGNGKTMAPSVRPGCVQCAVERLGGRNYCGSCGNLVRPRCEGKPVTVPLADASGFTARSERLDPEQVSEIMQRTYDIVLATVHDHGGTVNQFLGDGVMALFGETAGKHHAGRALSASLAIQEGLDTVRREVRRSYGLEFRVRMAINTGPVVIGTIGAALRTDYTAMGNTAGAASAMLHIAEPGQIVLTNETRDLVGDRYDFVEVGAMPLTESRETVIVYELIREMADYAESADLIAV